MKWCNNVNGEGKGKSHGSPHCQSETNHSFLRLISEGHSYEIVKPAKPALKNVTDVFMVLMIVFFAIEKQKALAGREERERGISFRREMLLHCLSKVCNTKRFERDTIGVDVTGILILIVIEMPPGKQKERRF